MNNKINTVAEFILESYGGDYRDLYLLSNTCHNYIFEANGKKYVWIVKGNKDVLWFEEHKQYRIIGNVHEELPDNRGIRVTHLKVTPI